jgi:hypothetical protein
MTMPTLERVVIHYLLLELNHYNGHNKESSNLLLILELNHGNDHSEESSNVLLTNGAKSWQWPQWRE